MIAAALAFVAAFGGGVAPAREALTVSPAHVSLVAGARTEVRIGPNPGPRLLVRTSVAGLALDARGRPRIVVARDASTWLTVRPRTIVVGRAGARVLVASHRPTHAQPGDHTAIVLLTAMSSAHAAVAVAMRVGLVVAVRVAGKVIRRVTVVNARAARGRLLITVANRGNVIETIGGNHLHVTITRPGHAPVHLLIARRALLPRSRAVLGFRVGAIHGRLVAHVALPRPGGGNAPVRTFPLRL